jgi:hypothetical protein
MLLLLLLSAADFLECQMMTNTNKCLLPEKEERRAQAWILLN